MKSNARTHMPKSTDFSALKKILPYLAKYKTRTLLALLVLVLSKLSS